MTLVWIVKCTLLLGAGWVAAFLLRRRPAAVRFAIHALTIAALLGLPWVELAVRRAGPSAAVTPAAATRTVAISGNASLGGEEGRGADNLELLWALGVIAMTLHTAAGHVLSVWRAPKVPMTVGVFRPRVVWPAGAEAWDSELRRSVQLHEDAHIARRDPAWNLAAQLARALYWFHPLVWMTVRQLQTERERACDDLVLTAGVRPSAYAAHLLTCAQMAADAPLTGLPMASHSQLGDRVASVVSANIARGTVSQRQRLMLVAGCCLFLFPLAAFGSPSIHVRSSSMLRKFMIPVFAFASATQAAELAGRVYDPSNATVPKAQVALRSQATAVEFKTSSGPAGEYRFEGVPAGTYDLEVLMPGFVRYQRRGIRLADNSSSAISAILKLGEVQESLQVNAPGQARPQQPRAPQRIQVGGNVRPVRLLKQAPAIYPETARSEGREGNVTLKAVIGKDGTIVSATVLPGADADLAAAAEQAVRQWVYEPTLLNGQPVETVTTVEINFRLGAN